MITASGVALSKIDGALDLAGTYLIGDLTSALVVTGTADVEGAAIQIDDERYQQQRGTLTSDTTLLDAADVTGLIATQAGGIDSHLGDGHFLWDITHDSDSVSVDIYAAIPGDANGDGNVDGQDFIIWNANKVQVGTDWVSGDFNDDGLTDALDFIIWNEHKFTSLDSSLVPEPATCWLLLLWPAIRLRRGRRHCGQHG